MAGINYKETKEYGTSLLTIYLGFSKNLKSIYGKRAYSTFLFKDIKTLDELDKKMRDNILNRGFVFVDYSQINSNLAKNGKSFGAIVTTSSIDEWDGLNVIEYKNKKEKVLNHYINELEKEYPNIKDYIEYFDVATPKTIKRYIKTPNGTPYGYAPTNREFFKIPKVKSKKIKNLYFVGQWVFCGGFSPSINSAKLVYDEIVLRKG